MLLAEYDYDIDIAVQREEEREIALKEGAYQKAIETGKLMRLRNYPIAEIVALTGLTQMEVEAL